MTTPIKTCMALVLGAQHAAKWKALERLHDLGIQALSIQKQPQDLEQDFVLVVVVHDVKELGTYHMLAHTHAPVVICHASPQHDRMCSETPFAHHIRLQDPLEQWQQVIQSAVDEERPTAQKCEPRLIGQSLAMQHVIHLVQRAAHTEATVLITGPSGAGKEVVAYGIHAQSKRAQGPWIVVNCAAIPSELIESELFGHTKGAFSGALAKRQGHFEAASGGTLFLDEIGDMPAHLQSKLLRVLQDKRITPLGASRSQCIDVRIVAATNQDLEQAVQEGRFRADLYHRLHVLPIQIPPLKDRLEDLPLLVAHINEELHDQYNSRVRLNADAMQAFERYTWPGNVRELHHVMERLLIEHPNHIVDVLDLPQNMHAGGAPLAAQHVHLPDNFSLKDKMTHLERLYVLKALHQADGVVTKAAELLGLKRTTLIEKMKKHQIQNEKES